MSEISNMDIYSRKGTKIVYAHPNAGNQYHQEFTKKLLTLGAEYTVDRTDVHNFSTDVYLVGFPDKAFNSIMFDAV